VAVIDKVHSDVPPAAFDMASCFHKCALTRFNVAVSSKRLGRHGFGLRTNIGRIATQSGAIDAVFLGLLGLSSNSAFRRVGLDTE
jgi:hypothetical protein